MASKQFMVIGLGSTGFFLARQLTALGHDVFAIDKNADKVQDIASLVAQAAVADSTRKKQLFALPVQRADFVVCCIGEDLEASLLTILNLKEFGVPESRIITKSASLEQSTILERLGIPHDNIFHPERDMAIALANRLDKPNMLDYLPFLEGYSIVELACPEHFYNKTLKELAFTSKYGIQVIAIRDTMEKEPKLGNLADYVLKDTDILFLLGTNEALEKIKA